MDHLIVVLLISIDSFTNETIVIFLIFLLEVFIIFIFLWKDYVKEFLIEGFILSLTLFHVNIWYTCMTDSQAIQRTGKPSVWSSER